jgi:serralysin
MPSNTQSLFGPLPTSSLVVAQEPPAPATTVIVKIISGDNRIDPLLDDIAYRFNNGSPVGTAVTVTFSFPASVPSTYTGEDALGWNPFSDQQKAATREILGQLQQQTRITFQEVAESANSSGTMRFSNNTQATSAGYALLPNSTQSENDADTWIAIGTETGVERGSYSWQTLVHEIGHAVGLNHPGNYNAGAAPKADAVGNFLSADEDAFFNSIMSYRQSAQEINSVWFMPYDVLTLRYLYGTNPVATGDNTYSYSDAAGRLIENLVDDGGIDTLDFSAVTAGIQLDLTPGAYSSVGKLASGANALANLTIAFDAVIEHAAGSPADDTMLGNAANNRLSGGAGNDTIDGAAGIDTAVYVAARSAYNVAVGNASVTVSGSEGNDTLTRIERLQFSDMKVALDLDGFAGITAKILGAVFGRESVENKQYAGIGLGLLDGGTSYFDLMQLALNARLGANAGAETVVNLLYTNVVGVAPGAAELATFTGMLNSGVHSATTLGILAADTSLNIANVNLVGLTQTGLEYL